MARLLGQTAFVVEFLDYRTPILTLFVGAGRYGIC
jgi:hypothetical protein